MLILHHYKWGWYPYHLQQLRSIQGKIMLPPTVEDQDGNVQERGMQSTTFDVFYPPAYSVEAPLLPWGLVSKLFRAFFFKWAFQLKKIMSPIYFYGNCNRYEEHNNTNW